MHDTVTISQREYDQLVRDSYKLAALEAGGVDNWEWYDESLKLIDEWNEEENNNG